jgi:hypothetical protein
MEMVWVVQRAEEATLANLGGIKTLHSFEHQRLQSD